MQGLLWTHPPKNYILDLKSWKTALVSRLNLNCADLNACDLFTFPHNISLHVLWLLLIRVMFLCPCSLLSYTVLLASASWEFKTVLWGGCFIWMSMKCPKMYNYFVEKACYNIKHHRKHYRTTTSQHSGKCWNTFRIRVASQTLQTTTLCSSKQEACNPDSFCRLKIYLRGKIGACLHVMAFFN